MSMIEITSQTTKQRAQSLFQEQQQSVYRQTDRLFAGLLIFQWFACILIALVLSPRTWAGHYSDVHIHVWTALLLGGAITIWPVVLVITKPGEAVTRHAVAIGQALYSALLIHLTGGRIESHFHIFGSLAFLSFYRDWRVLLTASIVVAIDHLARGLFFPQSVYGVTSIQLWRTVEHVWWVAFEDVFLIYACRCNVKETHITAFRQAEIESINEGIEETIRIRTAELRKAKRLLSMQYAVASALNQTVTWSDAISQALQIMADYLQKDSDTTFGAFWCPGETQQVMHCRASVQLPEGSFDPFLAACRATTFAPGAGLPGRVWSSNEPAYVTDLSTDKNFPRLQSAKECGINAAICFPVAVNDIVLGAIEFFTATPWELNAEELETFLALGRKIGQFTVRKQAEVELERLASIVQYSRDAIFTKSSEGTITSWNRGAERLFGHTADEAIGQQLSILVPEGKKAEVQAFVDKISRGERVDNYETQRITKDGTLIDVSISWSPLPDRSGDHIGCSITIRDIGERKEAERRVSEFNSVVSHELRTPLTSIRGALGLMASGVVEMASDEAVELLEVARGSTDRLIRLINDMLDLKKIEAGQMGLHKMKVDVQELVSETLRALSGMAEEEGIKLCDSSQAGSSVYADWDKTTQVLTNLLSNAIKFSPKHSEVSVVTRAGEQGRIRFCVIDNGPGISDQDMQKLFDKFQQLDSSDTRQKGGTGLGLAISKALVEEHNGTIGVESIVGQGSVFWFELPMYREAESEFKRERNAVAGSMLKEALGEDAA